MPDDTAYSAKTFGDLLLEMAVELGLARLTSTAGADQEPALPTDGSVLFKLRQRLNQGYRSFINGEDPIPSQDHREKPYTQWTFLTRTVVITFDPTGNGPLNLDGDAGRYRLPDSITGAPKQGWTLNNNGLYANTRVMSVTIERIRDELARSGTITGCPMWATTRPIPSPDSSLNGKAWEVVVAPRPSGTMTMTTEFRVAVRDLKDLDQLHIAGPEHDSTILLYALWTWYRRDDPSNKHYGRLAAAASQALRSSMEIDKRSRPMVVGLMQDPGVTAFAVNRGAIAAGQTTFVTYTQGIPTPG